MFLKRGKRINLKNKKKQIQKLRISLCFKVKSLKQKQKQIQVTLLPKEQCKTDTKISSPSNTFLLKSLDRCDRRTIIKNNDK